MNPKIREVMALALEVPESDIGDACSAETTTNWDSIRHLNLVMALEDAFNVSFSTEEIPALQSYSAIVRALADRGAA